MEFDYQEEAHRLLQLLVDDGYTVKTHIDDMNDVVVAKIYVQDGDKDVCLGTVTLKLTEG